MTNKWRSPLVLGPLIGVAFGAAMQFAGAIISTVHDAPQHLDCAVERRAVEQTYDDHPLAGSQPFDARSEIERQCHINEFIKQLKQDPAKPPPSPSPTASVHG